MICSQCGAILEDGATFCPQCGATVGSSDKTIQQNQQQYQQQYQQQQYQQQQYQQYQQPYPQNTPYPQNNDGYDYTPISMWGYFGYELLFSIPLVGFILLIVFSFGGTRNINLRNFARSYFCLMIVVAILVAIIIGIFGTGIFLAASSRYY